MSAFPSVMTEAMLQAAHEAAYETKGMDWRAAEQARWSAIIAAMPKQDDATRLVWAMNHIGLESTHRDFCNHVLNVGGVGDLADCRVFVDARMRK